MNLLDILIAIPLLLSAWSGFKHGFVHELAGLVALVLGIYAGIYLSDPMANWLVNNTDIQSQHVSIAAFGATFILVVIIVYLVGFVVSRMVKMLALSTINKAFGSVFAVVKAVVIWSVVLGILMRVNNDLEFIDLDRVDRSIVFKRMAYGGEWIIRQVEDYLPDFSDVV